ncbi:MAG: PAS domain S-box protein [Pseudomonadaceae bacterium]|nr:PAS domain S-box protein [Pseudomonadaceae bacterium]
MRWPPAFCPDCRGQQCRLLLLLRCILTATLLLNLAIVQAEQAPLAAKRILLLHSWAQGNPWPESVNRGVREGLLDAAQPIELYIESADTTRFSTQDYAALAEFIARKYALQPPDVLMAADEQALDFISRYRAQLFADKPLVFASFPQLDQAQLARLGNAYQVLDSQDVAGNFQLIQEFLPKARTLVLVGDAATTAGREGLVQAALQVRGEFAEVRDLRAVPIAELEKLLPELPADSAVFISPWVSDGQGRLLDPFVALPRLVGLLQVPSFAGVDLAFGFGVTGGKVSSGEWRGQALAAVARQLLSGASEAQARTQVAHQAVMFNYPALQRLGLAQRPLPAGSIVLNKPKAFYAANPQAFFGALAAIVLLLATIGFLISLLRMRQRATKQLLEGEARYRLLFEHNPSPMLVYDTEQLTCLAINEAFTQAFGYSFAELATLPVSVLIDPAQHPALLEAIRQAPTDTGSAVLKTYWRSVTRSGQLRDVEVSTQAIRLNQQPARIVLFNDITERLQAEAAQKNSEVRLNQIIESSPVAMVVLDAEQRVTHWNFAAERVTSIPAGVMVGKRHHLGKALGKDHRLLIEALMDGVTLEEMSKVSGAQIRESRFSSQVLEVDSYTASIDRWLHTEATLLRDARGSINGAIQTMLDISEVQRTSQQLAELNVGLERRMVARTAELSQAMNQLVQSEKLAALGSLVAGVAHELNTPLGNVMTVVTTLSDHLSALRVDVEGNRLRRSQLGEFVQTCTEACAILERNTRRAAELVTSFKQVAVDQASSRRRQFKLTDALQETLSTLAPLYKHKPVTVTTEVNEELLLDSFPGPLEQVITNLLSNAVTHALGGREHLQINIVASAIRWQGQPAMLLHISDDGLGMSSDVIHRAFEPFFTTRLGQGGSGLGLYVVYNLVTALLGGQIELESQLGQGSRFVLRIPLTAPLNVTEDVPATAR